MDYDSRDYGDNEYVSGETKVIDKKAVKAKLKKLSKYAKEQKFNKDYGDIATEYMNYAKYLASDGEHVEGGTKKSRKCIMCKKRPCTVVFFPCRHACVCESCRSEHGIGTTDTAVRAAWRACPLCMDEIKKVLPRDGRAEEKYWSWVHSVKPPIPSHKDFANKFKYAGKVLQEEGAAPTARKRRGRREIEYEDGTEGSSDEDSFAEGERVVWRIKEDSNPCCTIN